MIRRVGRAFAVLVAIIGIGFGVFVLAVEHPATSGPVRCWLQEQVYTQSWEPAPPGTPIVEATRVTDPVRDACDAADDPAIVVAGGAVWVLGTNKQRSLNVYDETGAVAARADDLGAPNNIDVREHEGRWIAMASDKDGEEIEAFILDPATGALTPSPGAPFPARVEEELYGLCLYLRGGELFVFTTDKSGLIVQYQWDASSGLEEVRSLRVETQPEGCVVDDANAVLFVGEEDIGVWRFNIGQHAATQGKLIAQTRPGGELVADVEGLAIYRGAAPSEGYLIASSQGDNTYAVFDRAPPHGFRGRFQIARRGEIIGDTDGLDVVSTPIGQTYPKGLLVVQDGFIRTGGLEGVHNQTGERRKQRFAYVSWEAVEEALGFSSD